jgi:hypothetical protein
MVGASRRKSGQGSLSRVSKRIAEVRMEEKTVAVGVEEFQGKRQGWLSKRG